jgi:hypothetical protein
MEPIRDSIICKRDREAPVYINGDGVLNKQEILHLNVDNAVQINVKACLLKMSSIK